MRSLNLPLHAPFPATAYREASDAFHIHVGRPIQSVLDIGANYGQCSAYLSRRNRIDPASVVCVEAHPDLAAQLREALPFVILEGAVALDRGPQAFLARDIDERRLGWSDVFLGRHGSWDRSGMSSLLVHEQDDNRDVTPITVPSIRVEDYLDETARVFDFVKIDVEGAALAALHSFGPRIDRANSIHIEAETRQIWAGQSLWNDVRRFLETSGFEMVLFRLDRHFLQCESYWIRTELIRSFLDDASD